MLHDALELASKRSGKKVPINFQVPLELKDNFDDLCNRYGVSVTGLLIALMEIALNDEINSFEVEVKSRFDVP